MRALSIPPNGWKKIGEILYADVKWIIRAPRPSRYETEDEYLRDFPEKIDILTPPRCPNCKAELEESKAFLWGYLWKCVLCEFQKRNREKFYVEAGRALIIAKRNIEEELEGQIRNN